MGETSQSFGFAILRIKHIPVLIGFALAAVRLCTTTASWRCTDQKIGHFAIYPHLLLQCILPPLAQM